MITPVLIPIVLKTFLQALKDAKLSMKKRSKIIKKSFNLSCQDCINFSKKIQMFEKFEKYFFPVLNLNFHAKNWRQIPFENNFGMKIQMIWKIRFFSTFEFEFFRAKIDVQTSCILDQIWHKNWNIWKIWFFPILNLNCRAKIDVQTSCILDRFWHKNSNIWKIRVFFPLWNMNFRAKIDV